MHIVPPPGDYEYWEWYSVYSWIGYFSHEINEPGDYYVVIESSWLPSHRIDFRVNDFEVVDLCGKIGEQVTAVVPSKLLYPLPLFYVTYDVQLGGESYMGRCGYSEPGSWVDWVFGLPDILIDKIAPFASQEDLAACLDTVIYTQSCLNHDVCVREYGYTDEICMPIFIQAIWDCIFADPCVSTCSAADADRSGDVSQLEIMSYIAQWKSGSVSQVDLMIGIGEWKNGCN